ncbi:MAG TPA: DUF3631 domain-containing protein [Candidatus Angelobacter sp.]|jgi:hypothetical protein|nr:DUF3631 domain-containing protein [Candidatus Angelobacter sp.]
MSSLTLINPAQSPDNSPTGAQLLDQVADFLGRYLQCSEHQRNLMALWCFHTHYWPSARVTPYLSIQSAEKQSGKSLCLQLLSLLCNSPVLTVGFTTSALIQHLDDSPTLLIDECQATLGSRARPKNPALRAILASGFQVGPGYTGKSGQRNLFSPKAFAGRAPLPEELADRSIPIILSPLDETQGPKVERFNLHRATLEAKRLQQDLSEWLPEPPHDQQDQENQLTAEDLDARLLAQIHEDISPEQQDQEEQDYLDAYPCYPLEDFPSHFSPRQRDMSELLLQLAGAIGGEWPARIRQALISLFEEQSAFDLRHSIQLLADIRECFAYHGYPARLSTAILLEWMQNRPARPWDADGPFTARTLARLLAAFEIHPRVQRNGKDNPARGYQLQDFAEPWQAHLGFRIPVTDHDPSEIVNQDAVCNAITDSAAVAADDLANEGKTHVTDQDQSEILNKDAGCNTVTDIAAVFRKENAATSMFQLEASS